MSLPVHSVCVPWSSAEYPRWLTSVTVRPADQNQARGWRREALRQLQPPERSQAKGQRRGRAKDAKVTPRMRGVTFASVAPVALSFLRPPQIPSFRNSYPDFHIPNYLQIHTSNQKMLSRIAYSPMISCIIRLNFVNEALLTAHRPVWHLMCC